MYDEGHHKQDQKNIEQQLRNSGGAGGDAAKAQDCGNQCNHEKRERPTQHLNLHVLVFAD